MTTLLLLLSIPALWIHRNIGLSLFALSLLSGYWGAYVSISGIVALIAFALMAIYYRKSQGTSKNIAWWSLFFTSLLFGFHLVPGFDNWLVIEPIQIGHGVLYEKGLSFDKLGTGILLLALAIPQVYKSSQSLIVGPFWPTFLITPILVFSLGLLTGYIGWDPKLPAIILIWAPLNLATCFVEEVFFRGLIQGSLSKKLNRYRYGPYLAIITAALLFGVAHIQGGVLYLLLATIAGLCYGYVFYKSMRIEAAILLHFTVNSLHFLLFTYPVAT